MGVENVDVWVQIMTTFPPPPPQTPELHALYQSVNSNVVMFKGPIPYYGSVYIHAYSAESTTKYSLIICALTLLCSTSKQSRVINSQSFPCTFLTSNGVRPARGVLVVMSE